MNKKNASTECPECEIGSLTRNNYFTGKLLVERDFKDEQRYYIDKLRLHQKRLHGEGVVCGLQVTEYATPGCQGRFVCVQPGFAKDCCGNDIVVPGQECIDITQFKSWIKLQSAVNAQGGAGKAGFTSAHTLQICVRYRECPTENIPVLYDDCGCDDSACAPNRILESYVFDLLVDPVLKISRGCLPEITAGNSLNAQISVSALSFDPAGTSLYALSSSTPGAVYKLDPAGQNILFTFALPGAGKAVAVSDDGTQVYVVSYDGGTAQSSLVVLNAADLSLVGTSAGVADDASAASLAALPLSKVAWLQSKGPQFLVWDVSTATPTQLPPVALTGSAAGLALGGDRTHAYYIDATNKQIGVIDVTGAVALPPLTLVPNPIEVLLASSSGPDVLAVIDGTNATITAIQVDPATELASIALLNQPLAAVADPQKKVLYLVTEQVSGTTTTYELQPFDLKKLVAGSPELPPDGTPSVLPAGPTAMATNGQEVFVIGAASANAAGTTPGYMVATSACPDLYALEDCDDCCTADCLVLATIRGYQPGFLIEDQTTPPADLVTDYTNQVARIDNKLGRLILPSTRRIAEVLESVAACGCACECGDQQSTTVVVTNPGTVIGLNPNLPKIIDIGCAHGANVGWNDFLTLQIQNFPITISVQDPPILAIYFNQKVDGIDRQTFRVEITYPMVEDQVYFPGIYNINRLQIYGQLVELVALGVTSTPHTGEVPLSAWAFIPYPTFWKTLAGLNIWAGQNARTDPWPALDLPCVRVTLSGDFIYTDGVYAESNLLDGDNIGGRVGLNAVRGGPITGGKNPSGDMVEGGVFESWFYLEQPSAAGGNEKVNLNKATGPQLQALPGVDTALSKRILAERKKAPFTDVKDFQTKLGLSDETVATLTGLVAF